MRLTDADKLKADLEKAISKNEDMDCLDFLRVASFIDAQPTAYDPDKVVEQLEKLKSLVPVNRVLDDIVNDKPKELGMLIAYEKAIEIVKGGGVDVGLQLTIDYDDIEADTKAEAIQIAKDRALEDIEWNNSDCDVDNTIVYSCYEEESEDE